MEYFKSYCLVNTRHYRTVQLVTPPTVVSAMRGNRILYVHDASLGGDWRFTNDSPSSHPLYLIGYVQIYYAQIPTVEILLEHSRAGVPALAAY